MPGTDDISRAKPRGVDVVLHKLNHRPAATVTVLGAPQEMQPVLEYWSMETTVRRELNDREQFVLAFVESHAAIAQCAPQVAAALDGDATLWMAYPKKASRRPASCPWCGSGCDSPWRRGPHLAAPIGVTAKPASSKLT